MSTSLDSTHMPALGKCDSLHQQGKRLYMWNGQMKANMLGVNEAENAVLLTLVTPFYPFYCLSSSQFSPPSLCVTLWRRIWRRTPSSVNYWPPCRNMWTTPGSLCRWKQSWTRYQKHHNGATFNQFVLYQYDLTYAFAATTQARLNRPVLGHLFFWICPCVEGMQRAFHCLQKHFCEISVVVYRQSRSCKATDASGCAPRASTSVCRRCCKSTASESTMGPHPLIKTWYTPPYVSSKLADNNMLSL